MALAEDLRTWWVAQPAATRQALATALALAMTLRFLGVTRALALAGAAWYLSTRLPAKASFLPFFEHWFKREYFPKFAEKLQHELAQRAARRRSILDSLSDKVNAWIVGSTKGLQANFVYNLVDKRVMYSDVFVARLASINVGSRDRPMPIAFVGVHNTWYLAPWHRMDFDCVSILEQLDKAAAH
ncbi:hypothetical protein KFE25_005946 [Diacronema lutheri]|uniref:Uncharacterized protein n=1 Tax=Diacronema lutheri TaxID=2081491 RepID=A0A8J6CFV0_DIALT|nr:hypothetical protein KFE25_005946 [Diacronema lutheri]